MFKNWLGFFGSIFLRCARPVVSERASARARSSHTKSSHQVVAGTTVDTLQEGHPLGFF